ncbi:hypothetical protein EV663_101598 [Rhodovulum bhavnagarense]|uniref:Lipoprotein n=1 Tax=Rhodovulum bhavnagarense TaxID=992286 RepID=A0A4R2RHV7_9RHOB|nr:DUF6778 family protein [Rhodovulum bhavnagarense]TCP63330.1 hypothetical protein EV663_101598 [Rhodovulum bhavnagarense]
MKTMRLSLSLVLAAALALSACASVETASRDAPLGLSPHLSLAAPQSGDLSHAPDAGLDVRAINVRVPLELTVSEANSYRPVADIVWRGDAFGDRHAQVQAIFEEAAKRAIAGARPGQEAVLDIQVTRFHALTEKARYTIGGVHDLHFFVALRDSRTGLPLAEPVLVQTELKAFGGTRAIKAMRQGETQKVRITRHLAGVIAEQLARFVPAGEAWRGSKGG